MKFIKYFKQLFEGFLDFNKFKNWRIFYYHNTNHDLEKRIKERTNIDDKTFNEILIKIINICENEKIEGEWVFASFKYNFKIIVDIENIKSEILIITILSSDQKTKETKNIKLI
jgi:hypothetical protein